MLRFLSFALAASLLTTACKDDDAADVNVTNEDLVGTWLLDEYDATTTTSTQFSGQRIEAEAKAELQTSAAEIIFKADGTYDSRGSYTIKTDAVTAGASSSQTQTLDITGSSGQWAVTGGNQLRLSGASFGPDITANTSVQVSAADYIITAFSAGERFEIRTTVDTTIAEPSLMLSVGSRVTCGPSSRSRLSPKPVLLGCGRTIAYAHVKACPVLPASHKPNSSERINQERFNDLLVGRGRCRKSRSKHGRPIYVSTCIRIQSSPVHSFLGLAHSPRFKNLNPPLLPGTPPRTPPPSPPARTSFWRKPHRPPQSIDPADPSRDHDP